MSINNNTLILEEIKDWKETIQFYLNEITRFEERLTALIRGYQQMELSARAEQYLYQFTEQIHRLLHLQNHIKQQEEELIELNNHHDLLLRQNSLRQAMLGTGKSFLEIKYDYQGFIAQLVKEEQTKSFS